MRGRIHACVEPVYSHTGTREHDRGASLARGATKSGIVWRRIFIDLGLRIVEAFGMVIGNILGIGLLLVQKHTGAIPLDPEMYYLASVPVEIKP